MLNSPADQIVSLELILPILPTRFRHYRRLALDALWVAGITVAVVGAVILLNLAPVASSDAERLGDAASIVQLLATAILPGRLTRTHFPEPVIASEAWQSR